jgi:diguanylate cyclase (GGDEF)-like protein
MPTFNFASLNNSFAATFLMFFLPPALLGAAATVYYYQTEVKADHTIQRLHEQYEVGLKTQSLSASLDELDIDIFYIANSFEKSGILDNPTAEAKEKYENVLYNYLTINQDYQQVRWIDNFGKERLRVDSKDGHLQVIAKEQLENKWDRYYFTQAINTDIGHIYLSPLDLSIEHGKVRIPYNPLIRIATPIADHYGNKRGIVILSLSATQLLNRFSAVKERGVNHAMLVNQDGYYLKGLKPEDEWGFMFKRDDLSLAKTNPSAWQRINQNDAGQFIDSDGLWTFDTEYPLSYLKAEGINRILHGVLPTKQSLASYKWKIVTRLSPQLFYAQNNKLFKRTLGVSIVLMISLLFGTWEIARYRIKNRLADKAMQRLTKLYAALSQCNQAIVRCTSEKELFPRLCEIAASIGGMKMAWVGILEEETKLIKPVAAFGTDIEYLEGIEVSLDANKATGRGPTSVAMREHRPYWCQHFMLDPAFAPWHERGKAYGWQGVASLPLYRHGVAVGAFILYSDTVNAFDQATRNLLMEMETDISYALDHFTNESERRKAEEKVYNLAFYDPLTKLPNRTLLMDRISHILETRIRNRHVSALLFIDLDNFKEINDNLGHHVGDLLLQQVALRLSSCVREGDTVARLGGDEFVVVLENLSEQTTVAMVQAEVLAEKLLAAHKLSYQLETYTYSGTASIGVALVNGNSPAADELLKQADIAMYQAKKAGRNTLRFFDPQMQATIADRFSLESELRKALELQQFHLYYQVQADSSHNPIGAEVLIRWLHPDRGMVSPAQFIPLAEETGLILPIGHWVLETACAQLKVWEQNALTHDLVLAVNVSARQFHQADFVSQVIAAVKRHAINPKLLKLELTEGMLIESIEETIATMGALNEVGVQLSLDDFGTGFSSLQYLKRLPLDQLKIDQSFVRDITTNKDDMAIVHTIIVMAQSLDMQVIAEGVETIEQRQLLLDRGCIHYQGYLFGKPMPIEQFEALLGQTCRNGRNSTDMDVLREDHHGRSSGWLQMGGA